MDAVSCAAPAHFTFWQGFVAGQAVFFVCALSLFRYVYMADVPASLAQQRAALLARTRAMQKSLDARTHAHPAPRMAHEETLEARMAEILRRTQYDVARHGPESLDWVNLMVAQIMYGYRASILYAARNLLDKDTDLDLPSLASDEQAGAKRLLERVFNQATAGLTRRVLDTIVVTDVDFGCAYPSLRNARFRPAHRAHALRLEMDFEYRDQIRLGLDTKLLLNFPQLRFGALAIAVGLRIERIAGTVGFEIDQIGDSAAQEVRVSINPDYLLEATVASSIGSKSRLQDLAKVEEVILTQLRRVVQSELVWPNYWSVPMPELGHENL